MTETPIQFDQFLSELKASLSGTDADAIIRRVNAERILKLVLDELIEDNQAERIRILSDNRLVGEAGADFLIQVDDYDLRLELLDTPDSIPTLDPNKLTNFLNLLENNPSTVALIVVWTADDLPAIPLSVARIRYILQHPARLPNLLATAKPLLEMLREFISRQTKSWETDLDQTPSLATKLTDTRQLFEQAIDEAIDTERKRSYHYSERKQAAEHFPIEQEKQIILSVLREILNGVPAKDLLSKLTHLPRRQTRRLFPVSYSRRG